MKRKTLLVIGMIMMVISGCKNDSSDGSNTPSSQTEITPIEIDKSEKGNPIGGFGAEGELIYGGDPAALVVGDTLYLYTGHDTSKGSSYVIPEYQCYSTKDMVNWNYEGVVLKMSDVAWADKNSAWAGQVAMHYDEASGKDKYYFYYCSWDNTDAGKQSIGVAVSESPTGPFTDMGQALVKGSFTTDETSAWNDIDPTVWIETDENGEEHRYLCWGNSKLYMCELNADMISVKDINGDGEVTFGHDVISRTTPDSLTEAPWIYRRQDENGNYYGDYYLFYAYGWREQMAYATTSNLMRGKWTFGDIIMEPSATSNTNHMAVVDFLGKTYFIYHNGSLPQGSGYRRVACVEELVFCEDGSIEYITETATGISGDISTLTTLKDETLTHSKFHNSSSDSKYPYVGMQMGTGLSVVSPEDTWWEIVPGKADETNAYYVSIEAYNKPGLYVTAAEGNVINLSQDYTGKMAEAQTFKTVSGLAGEGISFESVLYEGLYLTITDGNAALTDGADKEACSFIIE